MNNCEYSESLVSGWLDEELDRAEQVELLDHLARCERCRGFYLEARALEGLVAVVRTPAAARSPSPEVWKRIERLSAPTVRRSRVGTLSTWGWGSVAAAVLAVGFMLTLWSDRTAVRPVPGDLEIQLGEHAGRMTEERFIELTAEVLRSDRRYHAAMFQVMDQVLTETGAREASFEGLSPRSDREEPGEESTLRRSPA